MMSMVAVSAVISKQANLFKQPMNGSMGKRGTVTTQVLVLFVRVQGRPNPSVCRDRFGARIPNTNGALKERLLVRRKGGKERDKTQ
jgi:hypothetical protein